jgi:hypothetical protein
MQVDHNRLFTAGPLLTADFDLANFTSDMHRRLTNEVSFVAVPSESVWPTYELQDTDQDELTLLRQ